MLVYSDSQGLVKDGPPPHPTLTLAGSCVHLLALSMTILATQQLTSDSIWKLALMDDSSNDKQILKVKR